MSESHSLRALEQSKPYLNPVHTLVNVVLALLQRTCRENLDALHFGAIQVDLRNVHHGAKSAQSSRGVAGVPRESKSCPILERWSEFEPRSEALFEKKACHIIVV